jgi:LPS-assembly protein
LLLLAGAAGARAGTVPCAVLLASAGQPGASPPVEGALDAGLPAPAAIPPPPPALTDEIQWSSDAATAEPNGDRELRGNVTLHVGGRELHGDRLDYDAARGDLRLTGAVRYEDPSLRLTGDTGSFDQGVTRFSNAQFELLQQHGRGQAEAIVVPRPDVVELDNVAYTTCPKGATDWQLRARRITLDTRAMRGVGRSTRVEFKGVPILYLPWISFPLSSARQTGFLFPMLGSSSRSGAMIAVPWYWNIAPAQDLTLTPKVYWRRGFDLGAEYRRLSAATSSTLAVNYLPNDELANQLDRSWQRVSLRAQLPMHWRADLQAQNVSDTAYFEDFADGPQASSTVFLPRDLRLGFRDDVWQLRAQLLQFQTLDVQRDANGQPYLGDAERPYAQLPRISGGGRWQGGSGLGSFLDAELIDFRRDLGPTGWRGNVQPGINFDYTRPGFYLRPRAAWDLTAYRLQDTGATPANASRSLPILSLDSAMQLERISGSGGPRLVTLEPRLYYVYIPYRDQAGLPVFDSGVPDPNFVSLFRANRYAGLDRIGDANNLTFGVTARMLQASTGQRYLSATLGQTLHISQPRVTLAGETLDTRRRSDLIATIDLTAYRNWSVHYDVAWNPALSQTEKSLLSLQYRPAGDQVLNLGYRFTRGSIDQAEASVAWPVGRHWDLYGRSVYSFLDTSAVPPVPTRGPIENFAGFHYHENCWGVRLVVRNSVTKRDGTRDTGWYLQLELNGLSSVGSGADSFLQGAIQGYSPAPTNH